MIDGIITKIQTYSTGNDFKMDVIGDAKDKESAMKYDKAKVKIGLESEFQTEDRTLTELFEKLDTLMCGFLELTKLVKEMAEAEEKMQEIQSENLTNQKE